MIPDNGISVVPNYDQNGPRAPGAELALWGWNKWFEFIVYINPKNLAQESVKQSYALRGTELYMYCAVLLCIVQTLFALYANYKHLIF